MLCVAVAIHWFGSRCGHRSWPRHPQCFPDEPQRSLRGILAGFRVWKGPFNEAVALRAMLSFGQPTFVPGAELCLSLRQAGLERCLAAASGPDWELRHGASARVELCFCRTHRPLGAHICHLPQSVVTHPSQTAHAGTSLLRAHDEWCKAGIEKHCLVVREPFTCGLIRSNSCGLGSGPIEVPQALWTWLVVTASVRADSARDGRHVRWCSIHHGAPSYRHTLT